MENNAAVDAICSLNNPKVRTVLERLHGEASRQVGALTRVLALALIDAVLRRRISSAEEARRLKHIYVPTSRKQGTFLYLAARSVAARRIVEGKISARGAEELSAVVREVRVGERTKSVADANLSALEESLQRELKRKVRIIRQRGKKPGRVELEYYDEEDLNGLADRLMGVGGRGSAARD